MKRKMLVMLLVCGMIMVVGFARAQTTTYTGPNGAFNNDTWNNDANWDSGAGTVPSNTVNVVIETGKIPWSVNATPAYTGSLTLQANAGLGLLDSSHNALGTGPITMESGSQIILRTATYTFNQAFVLAGDAKIQLSSSTAGHNATRTFASGFSGAYALALDGQNGNVANLNTSNSFTNLTASVNGSANWKVVGGAAGSLGTGEVTINNAVNLVIGASGAMTNVTALYLNGARSTKVSGENKLVMNASDSVPLLTIDGFAYAAGTYGRVGLGTVTYEVPWISGNGILTILGAPDDNTPPSLVSTTDNAGGGPIVDVSQVTYTLTFSEPVVSSSITAADFEDGGTSGATINSVAATTSDLVFTVTATPLQPGTLILQIKQGAVIEDLFGNPLDTSSAVADDTVITVNAVPKIWSQLGILSTNVFTQNFGKNPATGDTWKRGDTYRLAFVTTATTDATSTNIATYNAFVQSVAEGSSTFPNLGDVNWYAIASTAEVNARDNTQTVPGVSPGDGPVYLMDGMTRFVASYAKLWDGSDPGLKINRTENNTAAVTTGWPFYASNGPVWTGTGNNGLASNPLGGSSVRFGLIAAESRFWMSRDITTSVTSSIPMYAISESLTVQGNAAGTVLIVK